MKAQLLVEFDNGQVIATATAEGKMHDFKLLKRSRLPFVPSQLCLADRGIRGLLSVMLGLVLPRRNRATNR
ncbi:hypothetical protein [Leptolyngbya sp. FACHB-711]|uniref:hypothetical protein n=1 Tax=Leptolyngbya sp. ST-U4 TaxID=2933912 RepID=UPI0016836C01|nr:hypothetical protein [Leptolyngbya sp. FACHB-711]